MALYKCCIIIIIIIGPACLHQSPARPGPFKLIYFPARPACRPAHADLYCRHRRTHRRKQAQQLSHANCIEKDVSAVPSRQTSTDKDWSTSLLRRPSLICRPKCNVSRIVSRWLVCGLQTGSACRPWSTDFSDYARPDDWNRLRTQTIVSETIVVNLHSYQINFGKVGLSYDMERHSFSVMHFCR